VKNNSITLKSTSKEDEIIKIDGKEQFDDYVCGLIAENSANYIKVKLRYVNKSGKLICKTIKYNKNNKLSKSLKKLNKEILKITSKYVPWIVDKIQDVVEDIIEEIGDVLNKKKDDDTMELEDISCDLVSISGDNEDNEVVKVKRIESIIEPEIVEIEESDELDKIKDKFEKLKESKEEKNKQ